MIRERVLIDTGPLVALLSENDQYRDVCYEQAREIALPVYTCWPVITEAAYLLRANPGACAQLLSTCDGSRFEILPLDAADLPGIKAILEKYRDQAFDLADACLMYLAEREEIGHIFTLDRRHFFVFVSTTGNALNLLPGR